MRQFLSRQPLKNIIIIFLLPIILSGSLYLFSSYRNIKVSKSNMSIQFSAKLNEFTELNKKLTNSIFQDFPNVTSFGSVKNILQSDIPVGTYDNVTLDAQSILRLYKQNNSMVDSVCLVNRTAQAVVTETNVYSFNDFFGQKYQYGKYDANYWNSIRVLPNSPKLLEASEAVFSGSNKIVIPYICTIPKTAGNSSYIIVNLDLEYVYTTLKSYKYSPNSEIFLMNNSTFRCLSASGMIDFPFGDESLKEDFLKKNYSTYNNVTIKKNNYYVMVASSTNSLYNFSYIVCVPNSDISNTTQPERTTFMLTILIEIVIFAIALFIFIFKIYKPLNYINRLTSHNENADSDIFNHIIDYIRASSDNITSLEGKFNEILPSGIQTYLYDLLKGKGERDPHLEEIAFKYKYFLPVSAEIILQQKFYEDINMPYLSVQAIDIINTQFEMNFQTYRISKSATTLSLLINLKNADDVDAVKETIQTIYSLFTADNMYISLYFGIGELMDDLSVLNDSFKQCMQQIHTSLTDERKSAAKSTAIFGHKESTQLNNYLINANTDAAVDLINNINARLIGAPRDVVKTVYSEVLFNIHNVMKLKGIYTAAESEVSDINYISEICSKPQNSIYDYTMQCIEQIDSAFSLSGSKLDIEAVILYVREHFTEDISLDMLAEKYGTYPQYLSKRIKQYLGLTFHDYISSLRIEKAKELLSSTAKEINEISKESGFVSRNTFLRVFKKYTGVTPSEYRKSEK